jgi:hypothetical protein
VASVLYRVNMEKRDVRVQLVMSPAEIEALDALRAERRTWSRSEAIRRLVPEGIKKPDKSQPRIEPMCEVVCTGLPCSPACESRSRWSLRAHFYRSASSFQQSRHWCPCSRQARQIPNTRATAQIRSRSRVRGEVFVASGPAAAMLFVAMIPK